MNVTVICNGSERSDCPAARSLPSNSLASSPTVLMRSCLFVCHSCCWMKLTLGYSFLAVSGRVHGVVLTDAMEQVDGALVLFTETQNLLSCLFLSVW